MPHPSKESFFRLPVNGAGFVAELSDVVRGILVITLNRPEALNGMNQGTKRDLMEVLNQAQMDSHIAVIVITGSGKAFSAGDDLNGNLLPSQLVPPIWPGHENAIGTYNGLRTLSQSLNVTVRNIDKLVIAAVQGYAIQTGFSLALAADFRILADDAKVGSATLRYGLLPDEGGQYLLIQHMGVAKTFDFLYRKKIVGAQEAMELGLAHQVVPREQLLDAAMDLARELADGPQVSMRLLKRSLYVAAESTFQASLEDIASKTAISDHHPDAQEGMKAVFFEKRPAVFNAWRKKLPGVKAKL